DIHVTGVQSCALPILFEWDFGDGHASNGPNADQHYEQSGTYTVCLLATWQDCADSTCTTIIVEESGSPCDSLNADFEHSAAGLRSEERRVGEEQLTR